VWWIEGCPVGLWMSGSSCRSFNHGSQSSFK
jgi:hypothetical protein